MEQAVGGSGGLLRFVGFCQGLIDIFRRVSAGRTSSYPDWSVKTNEATDLWIAAFIAVCLFGLRYTMHNFLLSSLLRHRNERDRSKLSEGIFYTFYYSCAFAFFFFVVYRNEEYLQKWDFFTNEPVVLNIFQPYPPPRSEFVQMYYMQALGFYASALVFLVAYDTRRSDFVQLFIHHIVTVGLVWVSHIYGYTRVGALIIALHDLGDIFLYGATTLNKLKFAGLDTAVFAVFAVTFYVTRLVVFPRLVYGVLVESFQYLLYIDSGFNEWGKYFETALVHWASFAVMLNTLILLHCFWFVLILRMIYREVFLGQKITKQGDIREDDD